MKNISSLFLTFLILVIAFSCTTEPQPENNYKLELTLEDVSCTEAWLQLNTENLQLPAEINIKRTDADGNSVSQISILNTQDSLLYIDSLLPNKTYTIKASIQSSNLLQTLGSELTFTTMDTTSQNFTFETFEFGDGFSSSYFNDVWIFDENNIWAVGYISPEDTIVNGIHIANPNIIKWNGESWELQPFTGTSSGIEGIWALDTSLIYFASGGLRKYENGVYSNITVKGNWTTGQRIEKLWGSSENNIYGVGPAGTIVHFNGESWSQIEFDKQWHFYEITGNEETGAAYAVAKNENNITIVVELKDSSVNIIYSSNENNPKLGSWTLHFENRRIYLADTKIWTLNPSTKETEIIYSLPIGITILTMGSYNKNDLYFYCSYYQGTNQLIHFNGSRYKIFEIPFITQTYGGISATKNTAVYGGYVNNKAYLIKIIRG